MPNLKGEAVTLGQDAFRSSADQIHDLGARGRDWAGRYYRYVLAGASDLVAGNVVQSPAVTTAHLANTPPAVAIGDTSFTYTPGAATGTANEYAGGLLQVDTTPGNGYSYAVEKHPAIASATAFTLNLRTDDAVQVALTTSSRVGLHHSPWRGVIQMPATTATGLAVGIATYIITTAQYGWIGTWGYFPVLISGTPALGAAVVAPSGTAGAAVVMDTTVLVTAQLVGYMLQIGVSGKNNMVFVKLHP